MIDLKPGVKVKGMQPEILLAAMVAHEEYHNLGYASCTLTSVTDGVHEKGSKHYTGQAIDLRTRALGPGAAQVIVEALKTRLGRDFDVVLEKDHIHVEFDPK